MTSSGVIDPAPTVAFPIGLEDFAESARKFCQWAERPSLAPDSEAASETDAATRLAFHLEEARVTLLLLARLYAGALALPAALAYEGMDGPDSPADLRDAIFNRFQSLPFRYYAEIYDPTSFPARDPVIGDIADDLADIYSDIKDAFILNDAGEHERALHGWQFSFATRWGRRAISAMRAIDSYVEQSSQSRRRLRSNR
jgi:uncharacterized protein DUF5063